jgi:hypothetical protein
VTADAGLQGDDLDEVAECLEVAALASVEREIGGESRCCHEEVGGSDTS